MEGPEAIENSTKGRLLPYEGAVRLGGLQNVTEDLRKIKRLDSPIRVHWYDNCIEGLYYINPHGITLNIKLEENLFKSAKMKFTCYGKKEDISEVERIVLSHIYADVGEEKEK